MRIRWTPAAAADLEQIKDYLAGRLPDLADRRFCACTIPFDP